MTKEKKGTGKGGRRPGAGRKPGSTTTNTRDVANKAHEEGRIPLSAMLANMMRGMELAEKFCAEIGDRPMTPAEQKTEIELRSFAQNAARDAAPFMHPRLNSIQMSGGVTVTHEAALAALK